MTNDNTKAQSEWMASKKGWMELEWSTTLIHPNYEVLCGRDKNGIFREALECNPDSDTDALHIFREKLTEEEQDQVDTEIMRIRPPHMALGAFALRLGPRKLLGIMMEVSPV